MEINASYINVDKASIDGVELEFGRHLSDRLTFRVVNTYLDATDDATGKRLNSRAENIISARLEYNDNKQDSFGIMLWNDYVTNYRYSGKDYDYNSLNICFTKEFGNMEAYFGVDNVLNKEVGDLYIDGRQWRLGVSMTI